MADAVNHPRHYNLHPSGIECVQISEELPGNIAAAFEYVWREGLKPEAPAVQDLKKAIWRVRREHSRYKEKSKAERLVSFPNAYNEKSAVEAMVRKVMDAEPDSLKASALHHVYMASFRSYYMDCAVDAILKMIARYDSPEQREARDELKKLCWDKRLKVKTSVLGVSFVYEPAGAASIILEGVDPVADLAALQSWLATVTKEGFKNK